jgi:hypothetical protein
MNKKLLKLLAKYIEDEELLCHHKNFVSLLNDNDLDSLTDQKLSDYFTNLKNQGAWVEYVNLYRYENKIYKLVLLKAYENQDIDMLKLIYDADDNKEYLREDLINLRDSIRENIRTNYSVESPQSYEVIDLFAKAYSLKHLRCDDDDKLYMAFKEDTGNDSETVSLRGIFSYHFFVKDVDKAMKYFGNLYESYKSSCFISWDLETEEKYRETKTEKEFYQDISKVYCKVKGINLAKSIPSLKKLTNPDMKKNLVNYMNFSSLKKYIQASVYRKEPESEQKNKDTKGGENHEMLLY